MLTIYFDKGIYLFLSKIVISCKVIECFRVPVLKISLEGNSVFNFIIPELSQFGKPIETTDVGKV